jgi:folate-binding protein YgfZ
VATGPDRLAWLNALVTCDVARLPAGAAAHGLALERKGKMLSEALVIDDGERTVLAVHGATSSSLLAVFEHHLVMEDAEIAAGPESARWIYAYGPRAAELADLAAASPGVVAAPVAMFGHPAAAILCRSPDRCPALESLAHGLGPGARIVGGEDWDRVRIDLGIPRFGIDLDETTYPQEAGLEELLISFTKGCYLGQEVVVKLRSRGHASRKLVRLLLPRDTPVPAPRDPVSCGEGGRPGVVTSASRSTVVESAPIAYAYVHIADSAPGTEVRVAGSPGTVIAPWGIVESHSAAGPVRPAS